MNTPGPNRSLETAYSELCKSYHAIDNFRTKLLGLLPLTSLAGVLLLTRDSVVPGQAPGSQLVGFASFFAAAFTLTLFVYEIRGILRCNGLISRGKKMEDLLRVEGQFGQCDYEAAVAASTKWPDRAVKFFNTTVAACLVYAWVFSAWLFLALRYAYGIRIYGCSITAILLGVVVGYVAYRIVRRAVPA